MVFIKPQDWLKFRSWAAEQGTVPIEHLDRFYSDQLEGEAIRRNIDMAGVPKESRTGALMFLLSGEDEDTERLGESADEKKRRTALGDAERILEELEDQFFGIGAHADEGGVLAYGRIPGAIETGQAILSEEANPRLKAYLAMRDSIKPRFAKALGDTGNFSEAEQKSAVKDIPTGTAGMEEALRYFSGKRTALGISQRDYGFGTGEEATGMPSTGATPSKYQAGGGVDFEKEAEGAPLLMRLLLRAQLLGAKPGVLSSAGTLAGHKLGGPIGAGAAQYIGGKLQQLLQQSVETGATGLGALREPEQTEEEKMSRIKQAATTTAASWLIPKLLNPGKTISGITQRAAGSPEYQVPSKEITDRAMEISMKKGGDVLGPGYQRQVGKIKLPQTLQPLATRTPLSTHYGELNEGQDAIRQALSERIHQDVPVTRITDPLYSSLSKIGGTAKMGLQRLPEWLARLLLWKSISNVGGQ